MNKQSKKETPRTAADYAQHHYSRLAAMRFHLDLFVQVYEHPRIGLRLIQRTHHNQHTSRQLYMYLGCTNYGETWGIRRDITELHGRLCVPHPVEPWRFELVAWVSYDEAVRATGRARRTLYRWRWNGHADPAAWRLLEWSAHGVCALPRDLLTL